MSVELETKPVPQPHPTEIVQFPIEDLFDPDWNPRPFFDEQEMNALTDYIAGGGIVPPILVWKGSGQPPHCVISGKRRKEAARRAGKTHIAAIIMDIPLEDAMFLAIASNRDNKPYWLGEFIAVENLKLKNDKLKQKDLVAKLGWSKKRVSHAESLNQLLTPVTRQLIYQTARQEVTRSNKMGDASDPKAPKGKAWLLAEKVAVRLIPLLGDRPLPEAQALTDKVVPILISRQFNGPQTEEIVAWVMSGKDLDQFQASPKKKMGKPSLKVARQNHMTDGNMVDQPAPHFAPNNLEDTGGPNTTQSDKDVVPETSDASPKQVLKSLSLPPMNKGQERLIKGLLTAIHWVMQTAWAVIKAVFQFFWTPFKDAVREVAGYLQRFMKGAIVFAIVLLFIGAIGWVVWQKVILHRDLGLPTFHKSEQLPTTSVPKPQVEGQGLIVPIPEPGIGNPVKHARHPKPVKPAPKTEAAKTTAPDIPDAYQNRVGMDKGFALGFARTFYGTSYKDPITWMDYFKEWVNESYYNDFYAAYFPQSRIAEMNDKKLTQSFWSNKPAQFVKADEMTDEFIIQGVVTTTSDKVYHGEVMSKKTVSLDIILMHAPGTKGLVYKLKEITLEGK